MTNLATRNAQSAPDKPHVQTGGALSAIIPQDIDQAYRLSQALAQSGDLIPRAFQGKPETIMAAVMKGMEIGLPPMQALASIAIINGRATVWGDAMVALVQSAGHNIDVEIEGDGDTLKATATLTRGDTGKQIKRSFSMADAKRAGLAGKPGPWQQYPQRMCSMRARSWAMRDGAADALHGMQQAEEVMDYGPNAARDVTPRETRVGRGVSFLPASPAPAPELEPLTGQSPEIDEIYNAVTLPGDGDDYLAEQASFLDPDPAPTEAEREEAMRQAQAAAMTQGELR